MPKPPDYDSDGRMTWYAANACAEGLNYGVYDDRRVPMANYFNDQNFPEGEAR